MKKLFYINSSEHKNIHIQNLAEAEDSVTFSFIREKCGIFIGQMIQCNTRGEFDQRGFHNFERRCNNFFNTIGVRDFSIIYDETIWVPEDNSKDKIKLLIQLSAVMHIHEIIFSLSDIKNKYNL